MSYLPDAVIRLDLSQAIEQARRGLLECEPTHIEYVDRVDTTTSKLPPALKNRRINIYALWTRAAHEACWRLRYVGQRSVRDGGARLEQHLFKVPAKTQSKLAEVRQALAEGLELGVTGILVEPDSLRLTIEDELIAVAKRQAKLWNLKGGPKAADRDRALLTVA